MKRASKIDRIISDVIHYGIAVEREIEQGVNMGCKANGNLNPFLVLLMLTIKKLKDSTGRHDETLGQIPTHHPTSCGGDKKR